MLRRFFIWRAERKMGRSRYRFDRRQYHGIFKPGFLADLTQSRFWQDDTDPYRLKQKRKRRFSKAIILLLTIGFFWLAWESLKAFRIF